VNTPLFRDVRVPFGGIKDSFGREGGLYGLDFYTHAKTICVALRAPTIPKLGAQAE
jgi:acyl-CoA reductase-like NAD-dependent aldehyde dehydrogenase